VAGAYTKGNPVWGLGPTEDLKVEEELHVFSSLILVLQNTHAKIESLSDTL